ncbi:MAG: PspC domain-containing protein [Actinomycetota bacterium]
MESTEPVTPAQDPLPDDPVPPALPKRLVRSLQNRWLAGVCAGMAGYFNLDPVLIRILFFVLVLTGGAGLPLYLLAWLMMPLEGEQESIGDSVIRKFRDGRQG